MAIKYKFLEDSGAATEDILVEVAIDLDDSGLGFSGLSGDFPSNIEVAESGVGVDTLSAGVAMSIEDSGQGYDLVGITLGDPSDPETRQHPQTVELYLAVKVPRTVWTCRVAADMPAERATITYDTGADAVGFDLDDFGVDLTLWIGSAAGLHDKGICRMRSIDDPNAAAGIIHVAADHTCIWTTGDYITITDIHELWPMLHRVLDSGKTYKDYDIPASSRVQEPVPIMGPPACAFIVSGSVASVDFDGRQSYAVRATLDDWAWPQPETGVVAWAWWFEGGDVGGGSEVSTESQVRVTYSVAGQYVVRLTVTSSEGKTYTAFRNVFIFDAVGGAVRPFTRLEVPTLRGTRSEGWAAEIRVLGDDVSLDVLPNGAQVVLFADEQFGGADRIVSYLYPGRTNIKLVGWIADSDTSSEADGPPCATLAIIGLAGYAGTFSNYPIYMTSVDPQAGDWAYFSTLTTRLLLYHYFRWHWTLYRFTDVYRIDRDAYLAGQNFPEGTLGDQLSRFVQDAQAFWAGDRSGALRICMDPVFNVDIRSTRPRVYLTTEDIVSLQVSLQDVFVSSVLVRGIFCYNKVWTPWWATPGWPVSIAADTYEAKEPPSRNFLGDEIVVENQILRSADHAALLAQLYYGWNTRRIASMQIVLGGNFSCLDIGPIFGADVTYQPVTTLRGLSWNHALMWITEMTDDIDTETGVLRTTITCVPNIDPEGEVGISRQAVTAPESPERNLRDAIDKRISDLLSGGSAGSAASGVDGADNPLGRTWMGLMGSYVYVSGKGTLEKLDDIQGRVYCRLLDGTPYRQVIAENGVLKPIFGRPVWIQELPYKGIYPKSHGSSFVIMGARYSELFPTTSDDFYMGRTHIIQQAVFTIEGALVVANNAVPSLLVDSAGVEAFEIIAYVRTAPVGSDIELDVNVDGSSILSADTSFKILDGEHIGTVPISPPESLDANVRLDLDVVAIGSGTAGSDLTVLVRVRQIGV